VTSTPANEYDDTLMGACEAVGAACDVVEEPPLPPPAALGAAPAALAALANLPETFIAVSVSPPTACFTPPREAMCVTLVTTSDCCPGELRIAARENALPWPPWLPGFILKLCGPPCESLAVCVTVMSVPTPYSECRTVSCALLTPLAYAVTATTSPTPTARPRAVSSA